MVNSFLAESVGSDGYAIKGPAAAALQAGAALIALAGDQIGFTSRPVMQMPAATPTPGQVLAWTGSSWEPTSISAGTPGGTSGQLQFNNGGVFDGVTGSYVSGSDVTLAGNLSLAANKQIEFGSVGIVKQSSNLLYLQSANGIRFRNMGDTAYTSAVGESFIGTDYVQGYTAVRVGQSSGGRLLPITDGVAVYNWAQSGLGNVNTAYTYAQNGFYSGTATNSIRMELGSGGLGLTSTNGVSWAPASTYGNIGDVYNVADAKIVRNTTGQIDVRADSGLRIRNFANGADGPFSASTGTFSGNVTTSGKYIGTGGAASGAFLGSSASLGLEVVSSTVLLWDGSSNVYASINRSSTKGISTTTDGAFAFGTSTTNANVFGADALLVRNATGPAVQVQAAGGLNVKNLAGSADAPVTCGNVNTDYVGRSSSVEPSIRFTSSQGQFWAAGVNMYYWNNNGWYPTTTGYANLGMLNQAWAALSLERPSWQGNTALVNVRHKSGGDPTHTAITVTDYGLTSYFNVAHNGNITSSGILALTSTTAASNKIQWKDDGAGDWIIASGGVASTDGFRIVKQGVADIAAFRPSQSVIYTPWIVSGGTVTASTPALNVSQTWNNAAIAFTGIQENITLTAASASSKYLDLQKSGTSQFYVGRGAMRLAAEGYEATNYWNWSIDVNNPVTTTVGGNGHYWMEGAGRWFFVKNGQSNYIAMQSGTSGSTQNIDLDAVVRFSNTSNYANMMADLGLRVLKRDQTTLGTITAAKQELYPVATTDKGLCIKMVSSHAANPFEIQRSDGTANVYFKATGGFTFDGASILPASGNNYVRPSLGLDLGFDGTNSYHVLSLWGSSASWQVSIHGNNGTHMGNRYGDFVISSSGHAIRNQASNNGGHLILEFPEIGAAVARTFKIRRTNYTTATDIMTIDNTSLMTYAGNINLTGYFTPAATTNYVVAARGLASQTGNLYEAQTSTGAVVWQVDPNGSMKMKASPNIGTGLGVELKTTDSYRDLTIVTTATNQTVNIQGVLEVTARSGSNHEIKLGNISAGTTPILRASNNNQLEVQNAKLLVQLNASATGNGIELKTSGGTSLFSVSVAGDAVFSSTVTSAFQTLSADPTTTDISAGNQRMVKNSTSGTLKLWANDAGTMKSVTLT